MQSILFKVFSIVVAMAVISIMLNFFTDKSNVDLDLTEYRQEIRGNSAYIQASLRKLCDVCSYERDTNSDCYFAHIYWVYDGKSFDVQSIPGTFTLKSGENILKMSNQDGTCWVTQFE